MYAVSLRIDNPAVRSPSWSLLSSTDCANIPLDGPRFLPYGWRDRKPLPPVCSRTSLSFSFPLTCFSSRLTSEGRCWNHSAFLVVKRRNTEQCHPDNLQLEHQTAWPRTLIAPLDVDARTFSAAVLFIGPVRCTHRVLRYFRFVSSPRSSNGHGVSQSS